MIRRTTRSPRSGPLCPATTGCRSKGGRHAAKSAAPSRLEPCKQVSGRLAQILLTVVRRVIGVGLVVTIVAGIDIIAIVDEARAQRDGPGLFDGVEAHGLWQPGGRLFADFVQIGRVWVGGQVGPDG